MLKVMNIEFDLKKSQLEGIEMYGKLIIKKGDDNVSVNISVRKNKDKELFICFPSHKSKEGDYYNDVYLSEDLYKEANKKLNKEFN